MKSQPTYEQVRVSDEERVGKRRKNYMTLKMIFETDLN